MEIGGIAPDEYDRAAELWEASVRATHDFVTEADLNVFRPLVRASFGAIEHLAGLRADDGLLIGFIGVAEGNVEMLFLDPAYRARGGGSMLLAHAFKTFDATSVDVQRAEPAGHRVLPAPRLPGRRPERDGLDQQALPDPAPGALACDLQDVDRCVRVGLGEAEGPLDGFRPWSRRG